VLCLGVEYLTDFVVKKKAIDREVEAQISKALRLKLLTSKQFQIMRKVALDNMYNPNLKVEDFKFIFEFLNLRKHTEMELISWMWFFSRKLGALAAKEIYKSVTGYEDTIFWVESVPLGNYDIDFLVTPEGKQVIRSCGTVEGNKIIVGEALTYINGYYRNGFRVDYADLDKFILVGSYKYQ
jgi:hypothetical protein